jgi:hypothetical protein
MDPNPLWQQYDLHQRQIDDPLADGRLSKDRDGSNSWDVSSQLEFIGYGSAGKKACNEPSTRCQECELNLR